jgi:hypothetical protein
MNKAMRVVELLWLAVAAVSIVEGLHGMGVDWNRTIKFSLFFGASVFMYFLRRKGRLKQMDK